jgi:hypothetical protein
MDASFDTSDIELHIFILLVCDAHVHHTFFTCSSNINITICINMKKLQIVQFAKENLKALYVLTYKLLGLIAI